MTPSPLHRRDVLKGLGAVAASSLTGGGCQKQSLSMPGSIEHIVVVTMENRSFDHYFTALNWEENRNILSPPKSWRDSGLNNVPVAPFHTLTHCVHPDPPHSWGTSRIQLAEGQCDGFVEAMVARHGATGFDPNVVMGFHNREQLPICYAMADDYVLCQRWFASQLSSTWPNRLYSHSAQNLGIRGNQLPSGSIQYEMPHIWGQLSEADIEWSYYFSDLPFIALLKNIDSERVRQIESFYWDCERGTLPAFSMVEPSFSFNDDHPPRHPMLGQLFLATIHNALANSPLWEKTLLIITYDEHGGFFDHQTPPRMADNFAAQGFDQAGFRVPAMICGPWVKSGYVDSIDRDHTTPLAELQARHGLDPMTLRDANATDLENCYDLDAMAAGTPLSPSSLPVIEMTEEEIEAQCNTDNQRGKYRTGQPELETYLNAIEHPLWMERKLSLSDLHRFNIEQAVALGALVIR